VASQCVAGMLSVEGILLQHHLGCALLELCCVWEHVVELIVWVECAGI
jgi:hypothetical protein